MVSWVFGGWFLFIVWIMCRLSLKFWIMKKFFLFYFLPHPRSCKFYFLHFSQIHSLLSLLVPSDQGISHLDDFSSFLTGAQCTSRAMSSITPTVLLVLVPPAHKSRVPWTAQPSLHPEVTSYIPAMWPCLPPNLPEDHALWTSALIF